jgi:hypothetical protein
MRGRRASIATLAEAPESLRRHRRGNGDRMKPDSDLGPALELTIETLTTTGQLEDVDAAIVAVCRTLAAALAIDDHNASLWRQYLTALEHLRGTNDASDGPDIGSFLQHLSTAPSDPSPA